MAEQFFEDFQRHPRVEEVRRTRMPQAVRRIMGGEARRCEILVHEAIDLRAKEVGTAALGTRKHVRAWGVVLLPALPGLGDIGREIDDAIDPPFALIDAHRARWEVNGVPRQGTRLRDPQATAQHEEEQEAIPEGVNDLKEGHEVRVRDRFGQPLRDQKAMLAAADGLL